MLNDASSDDDDEIPFDVSEHFFRHLSEGFFCPPGEHDRLYRKHRDDLRGAGQSHRDYIGITELADMLDPRLPRNSHIPDFLGKSYIYHGNELYTSNIDPVKRRPDLTIQARHLAPANLKKMFKGTADNNAQPPQQVCMFLEDHSLLHCPPTITVDIDSICGTIENLATFRKGWMFYPHNKLLMNGKVHGIRLPVYDNYVPGSDSLVFKAQFSQPYPSPRSLPSLVDGPHSENGSLDPTPAYTTKDSRSDKNIQNFVNRARNPEQLRLPSATLNAQFFGWSHWMNTFNMVRQCI